MIPAVVALTAKTLAPQVAKGGLSNLGFGFMSKYKPQGVDPNAPGADSSFKDQMMYGIGAGSFQNGNAKSAYGLGFKSDQIPQVNTQGMMNPQDVFGMMNQLQFQPGRPRQIQAQFSYVPRVKRRGLL